MQVTDYLNRSLARDQSPVVVNLASQEYFKVVRPKALKARVVECVFEERKAGGWQVISFFAKRARGLMARHAIEHRISTPAGLQSFNRERYAFDAGASGPQRMVFRREGT